MLLTDRSINRPTYQHDRLIHRVLGFFARDKTKNRFEIYHRPLPTSIHQSISYLNRQPLLVASVDWMVKRREVLNLFTQWLVRQEDKGMNSEKIKTMVKYLPLLEQKPKLVAYQVL